MTDTTSTHKLLLEAKRAYNALELESALKAYSAVADDPDLAYQANLGQARTLTRMRKTDEAEAAAQRCIEIDPDRFEAYATLGVLRFLEDKLEEAQTQLAKAIELGADDPEPQLTLAQVQADLADYEASEETLAKAEDLVAAMADETARAQMEAMVWHARTYLYLAQSKQNEAIEAAQEVIAREEANPYAACLAYSNIGILEARARHYAQAVDYLERAYELNPHFYRAGNALGRLLIIRKRYAEAAEVLAQVIETVPEDSANMRYAYALALARSKQRFEALEQYQRALSLGLGGLEMISARWQMIWLSALGRYIIIGVAMAAVAVWLWRFQPTPEMLTGVAILALILILQRTVGRKQG